MLNTNKLFSAFIKNLKQDKLFIIGNYIKQGAASLFTLLIAKNIDPDSYGIFGLALLAEVYFRFAYLGINHSINKQLSIDKDDLRVYKFYLLSIIYLISVVIVAFIVVSNLNVIPGLKQYFLFLFLYIIFNFIYQCNIGILRAFRFSKALGYTNISSAISTVLILFYYIIYGIPASPEPLFIKLVIVSLVQTIISFSFLVVKRLDLYAIIRQKASAKYYFSLVKQGFYLMIYNYSSDIYNSLDRLFIVNFYGTASLGFYTFANQILKPFNMLIRSFTFLDWSTYLKKYNNASKESYSETTKKFKIKYLFIWISVFFLSITVSYFIIFFYLDNYKMSFFILIVLLFRLLIRLFNFSPANYLISNNHYITLIKNLFTSIVLTALVHYVISYLQIAFIFIVISSVLSTGFLYNYLLNRATNKFLKSNL